MKDLAVFDKSALVEIWNIHPRCPLNGLPAVDWHHVKGRGNPKDPTDRKLHSSVFNAFPIDRQTHQQCPFLHHPGFEQALLDHIAKIVWHAVACKRYSLTDTDYAFINGTWQRPAVESEA